MSDNYNSVLNSHFIINLLNNNNPFPNIMPSYMRNIHSIKQTKQEMSNLSWEKEGEKVSIPKFLANKQTKNFSIKRRKANNKTFNT